MADSKPPPASPLPELGYVNDRRGWWQMDLEPIPELQWPQLLAIVDSMRRQDAQVASVLRAVTLPLRRTRWWIDKAGASDRVTEHVAADMGLPIKGTSAEDVPQARTRDRFSWKKHLELVLLMLVYGHMPFEQVYRYNENENLLHLRKLGPRMPRTIQKFNIADDGGLISIEQRPLPPRPGLHNGLEKIVIPVDRLVVHVHQMEGSNWTGTSLLRPAYKHWLIKDALLRINGMSIDRNGLGVPRYTGAENETSLDKGLAMATAWRAGSNAGAAVPFGAKLDLVGVTGNVIDALPAIRYHDEQIARAVLAHFLNLGTQTGSWALGTTFADFFTMSLQTTADDVADVTTQHVIEDLVDVNYGPDEPAPRLVCDEIGAQHDPTAAAIKMLIDAGAIFPDPELDAFMRAAYGLPPKAPRNPPAAPAEAA